jgi:methylmalonyl-CoA mutase N-terminal domain/subunit
LTDEIERGARAHIERIDAMGGTLAAIESGFISGEIQNAAYAAQKAVESGEAVVVGVNRFEEAGGHPPKTFRIDPAIELRQIERVRALRASRGAERAESALAELEAAARGSENLMPRIVKACEARATVGEISDRLRRVFGEYAAT